MTSVLSENLVQQKTKCDNIEHVRSLNVWGMELEDIAILRRLPALQVCSLSVNRIDSLAVFEACPDLRELYLRKNRIVDLRELYYLRRCPRLRSLWLGENPIAAHPGYRLLAVKLLHGLTKLDDADITDEERAQAKRLSKEQLLAGDLRVSPRDPPSNRASPAAAPAAAPRAQHGGGRQSGSGMPPPPQQQQPPPRASAAEREAKREREHRNPSGGGGASARPGAPNGVSPKLAPRGAPGGGAAAAAGGRTSGTSNMGLPSPSHRNAGGAGKKEPLQPALVIQQAPLNVAPKGKPRPQQKASYVDPAARPSPPQSPRAAASPPPDTDTQDAMLQSVLRLLPHLSDRGLQGVAHELVMLRHRHEDEDAGRWRRP